MVNINFIIFNQLEMDTIENIQEEQKIKEENKTKHEQSQEIVIDYEGSHFYLFLFILIHIYK